MHFCRKGMVGVVDVVDMVGVVDDDLTASSKNLASVPATPSPILTPIPRR